MSKFMELPKENLNLTTKTINQVKLELDINDFYSNDIILISSSTATGKTRAIGKIAKELKAKYNSNILSIVNLISLSREQILTFQEESGVELKDYQKEITQFGTSDGVICINSLHKLLNIEDFDMSNTILYIDEVNDLIHTMTQNDSLDKVLNMVYSFLIQLIKKCKKVIFSDATINKNTLNLLSSRQTNNKTILIKNTCKKFEGVEAKRFNDENEFINQMRHHIQNKKYFLFGCDLCKRITSIFSKLIEEFPEQKDDFILITGETKFRPTNASIQFKNKYVFYSPSITTGVSFVFKDVKQTQFLYISENPPITPISFYQMASRTRNIDKLYYYSREIKDRPMECSTIKEVENKYKTMIKYNEKLLGLSKSVNENDEIKIINNTYFKIFCYEEYQDSIFRTGFIKHFENILKDNGFNVVETGVYKKLDKEDQKEINEVYNQIKEDDFDTFVKAKYKDVTDEEDLTKHTEIINQYNVMNNRLSILNIPNKEEAEKYKVFIMDEYALRNYYNFLSLFRESVYIKAKLKEKQQATFKVKVVNNMFSKVALLEQFELHYKIDRFTLDLKDVDETKEISNEFKELYKQLFPKQKAKAFKTKYDLIKIYVNIIKYICGDLPIIKSIKGKDDKKSVYKYSLNKELLKELITLCKFNNPVLKHFDIVLIERITGIKPEPKTSLTITDEDDLVNNYLFNKINYKR